MRATPEAGSLETLTFFVDRSLGQEKVVAALRAQGAIVERHDDHFPQDAPDPVWLAEVGRRNWGKDKRIRHRAAERMAVAGSQVAMFIFIGGNMTGPEIAQRIARALMQMVRIVATQSRPFIATISKSGIVKLLDVFSE